MTLVGSIDVAQRTRLSGWAMRPGAASTPVELDIVAAATLRTSERPLARILANRYVQHLDPRATGYEGRLGFDIDLRDLDLPQNSFVLGVRDAHGQAPVPGAPLFIPAVGFKPPASPMLLAEVDGSPVACLPDDVHLCVLRQNGLLHIELPAGMSGVMLCATPRIVPGDARHLGAVLYNAAIDGDPVPLDSPALAFGFHQPERELTRVWRWSAGEAFLAFGASAAPSSLTLQVGGLPEAAGFAPEPGWAWQLSARFRFVRPADAGRPSVAGRLLGPPLSPDKRRVLVRPGFATHPPSRFAQAQPRWVASYEHLQTFQGSAPNPARGQSSAGHLQMKG